MAFMKDFRQFLISNKVFITVVGLLMGEEIRRLSRSVVDNLIELLFDLDLNGDGDPDVTIFNKIVVVYGMKFNLGNVLKDLLHFFIIVIVALLISRTTRDMIKD